MEKFLVSRFDVYNYRFREMVHRGFGSVHSELNQILQNKVSVKRSTPTQLERNEV